MKKVGDDQGNMEGRLISFLFHDLDVFFFPSIRQFYLLDVYFVKLPLDFSFAISHFIWPFLSFRLSFLHLAISFISSLSFVLVFFFL